MEANSQIVYLQTEEGETVYASNKEWSDLYIPDAIIRTLELKGWIRPTLIQGLAIPAINEGRNLIAQSKNGTGKTGAFILGTLGVVNPDQQALQVICISHTRELNIQNYEIFRELAEGSGVRIGCAEKGIKAIPEGQVLCGTHGLIKNIIARAPQPVLDAISLIVYDEADLMFQHPENFEVIRAIRQRIPHTKQLLFSATFNQKVSDFIRTEIQNPVRIKIKTQADLSLQNIQQFVVQCDHSRKFQTVLQILRSVQNLKCCIVFVNTTNYLDSLYQFLLKQGYKVHVLAAQRMDPQTRDRVIQKIRRGQVRVLLSTNIISRGIDFRLVNLVINIDPPTTKDRVPDPVTYIHRIGRTGRYGRRGLAVNIVADQQSQAAFISIQNYFNTRFESIRIEELDKVLGEFRDDYETTDEV